MKKSREETLARRYCEYLGLRLEVRRRPDGQILAVKCCPTGPTYGLDSPEYRSFECFFFGDEYSYGMCEKLSDGFYDNNSVWGAINNMTIQASTLDELEIQLAARGF